MSHVPFDKSLSSWIRELEQENKIYKFYKTTEWITLRENILSENHYECQHCAEHGKYTRATMVHHVNELRKRPELALSRTYIDGEGNEHKQLVPLCHFCHEAEHGRFDEWNRKRIANKFMNTERWE